MIWKGGFEMIGFAFLYAANNVVEQIGRSEAHIWKQVSSLVIEE